MEEMAVLIAKSHAGDREARRALIEGNLGLVHHIVRRFAGRGHEAEDLFQIGTIGLIKAIDKFDLRMKVQFSTYAVPMITGEIKRFLRDDGMIKVSRTLKENARKIKLSRRILQTKWNREPTIQEIAREAQLSVEDIVTAIEADATVESIYSRVDQDDGSEIFLVDKVIRGHSGSVGSRFTDEGAGSGDSEKEVLLNHILLEQLLHSLSKKERDLIAMRYFQNKTQVEIAKVLGVSQVQISRMEKKILQRLREQCREDK